MKKIVSLFCFALLVSAGISLAHEGHEHATVNPFQIEWGLRGAQEAINIHPLFVHFPIALLLTAIIFYFLGGVLKKEQPLVAGKWALIAGAVAAGFTVWTGLQAAGTVPHGGATHSIMIVHQYFGYGILGLSAILSLWVLISKSNLPQKGRGLFLILLVVLAGLVTQGADLGGRMVFQHGVGVGKSAPQTGAPHDHGHGDISGIENSHGHGEHAH